MSSARPAPPAHPSLHPKPWEEKNPWIAGILAYLIPGAGHFYQGRTTKGLIYFFSILGLFVWGQKMGEGMVIYNRPESGGTLPLRHVALSYAAQLGVGGPALPALWQNRRANDPDNQIVRRLKSPLTAPFQGTLNPSENPDTGRLAGTIRLEPAEGQFGPEVRGTIAGTLDGQPIELILGAGRFELDRPVKAGFQRKLECAVADADASVHSAPRWISGTIPRSFIDAYGAPPDTEQLQDINGRLGKLYELALVFTWIAGLLNVLAIWDCVLGPAYGFGDEYKLLKQSEPQPVPSPPSAASSPSSSPATPQESPVSGAGSRQSAKGSRDFEGVETL